MVSVAEEAARVRFRVLIWHGDSSACVLPVRAPRRAGWAGSLAGWGGGRTCGMWVCQCGPPASGCTRKDGSEPASKRVGWPDHFICLSWPDFCLLFSSSSSSHSLGLGWVSVLRRWSDKQEKTRKEREGSGRRISRCGKRITNLHRPVLRGTSPSSRPLGFSRKLCLYVHSASSCFLCLYRELFLFCPDESATCLCSSPLPLHACGMPTCVCMYVRL